MKSSKEGQSLISLRNLFLQQSFSFLEVLSLLQEIGQLVVQFEDLLKLLSVLVLQELQGLLLLLQLLLEFFHLFLVLFGHLIEVKYLLSLHLLDLRFLLLVFLAEFGVVQALVFEIALLVFDDFLHFLLLREEKIHGLQKVFLLNVSLVGQLEQLGIEDLLKDLVFASFGLLQLILEPVNYLHVVLFRDVEMQLLD